jgi:hypothetical protein
LSPFADIPPDQLKKTPGENTNTQRGRFLAANIVLSTMSGVCVEGAAFGHAISIQGLRRKSNRRIQEQAVEQDQRLDGK